MDKRNLAFGRVNFILLAVSMIIIIVGFILMGSKGSDETAFNPEIFNTMHIKVAPVVCFIGFVMMIYAVVHKTKDEEDKK